jgi:hypothetical protein
VFSPYVTTMSTTSLHRFSRLLMPVLLLLSVAPLFSAQTVMSQQFSTLTSYRTTTGTSSSLEYYSQRITAVQTKGFTWSFTITHRIGTGPYPFSCLVGVAPFPYNITRSQTVHVDYSSNTPTDFALFDSTKFTSWLAGGFPNPCDIMVRVSKDGAQGVTSGSYDIAVSPSGNPYWFIFVGSPSIVPKIGVVVNGILLQEPTFVTLTNTYLIKDTSTLTSFETQQLQQPPILASNGSWLLPLAIVVIVAALLFVTWPRKGKKRRRTTRKVTSGRKRSSSA